MNDKRLSPRALSKTINEALDILRQGGVVVMPPDAEQARKAAERAEQRREEA